MAGFLGCGDVYANRKIGGVDSGWVLLGNATKLGIQTNTELKERTSKSCNTYGQVIDSVSIKQPDDLMLTLDDLQKDNLAAIFLGDASNKSISGGSVADEDQTVAFGKLVQTTQENISNVVITNTGGVTTYVAGTDYRIENAAMGFIEILESGTISDAEVIEITYDHGAVASELIRGGTNSNVTMAIKLAGKNLVDDTNVTVNIWEAILSPQTEIDFLSDEFNTLEFNGRINLDEARGNGFEIEINRVLS